MILLLRAVALVCGPVVLVFASGAVQAAAGVFAAWLVPFRQVFMVQALRLHIGVRHQVDVAVNVILETHQDHPCTHKLKTR